MILLSNLMNETPSFSRISDPASWLEGHYKQLDTVLRAFSRRKGLKEEEMEELRSEIHLHLVERDYAVLRSWDGSADLSTFLYSVITRRLIDFIRSRHGRWRPSRKAVALGELAVKLEEMLHQRRYSFEETFQILTVNFGFQVDRDELARLASQLRMPRPPSLEPDVDPETLGTSTNPEQSLQAASDETLIERVVSILEVSGQHLEDQDRLLLQMRFEEGLTLSRAARLLGLERPHAERKLKQVFDNLRQKVLEAGIEEEALMGLLRISS